MIAQGNDRSAYELVLEERIADMLLDRQDKNGALVDQFFEKPAFKRVLMSYLADTYDEFRAQPV